MSSSIPSRFWLLVILSGLSSISCFGYAGIQTLDDTSSAQSRTRQNADDTAGTTTTTSLRLRNPISFVRDLGR